MGTKFSPISKKITLIEIDFLQGQSFWSNYTAGVWYVDFDAVYERIDSAFLAGVAAQSIVTIGGVVENGTPLTSVGSIALVTSTDSSYYWDLSDRRLFIHLSGGDEPSSSLVLLGVTYGVSNHAGYYNNLYYEARIMSAPTFSRNKDPLFFGVLTFSADSIELLNDDGAFDQIGEASSGLYGAEMRVLQGFDDDAYASFVRLATLMVERVTISRERAVFGVTDRRKGLSRSIPLNRFLLSTYPYLENRNVGAPIPLVWGAVKGMPVVCVNQKEVAPADWDFVFADTTTHPVKELTAVYVNGVAKTPSASSLANGTFSLLVTDYSAGDVVTADVIGFESSGTAIINPADVIKDILVTFFGLTYGVTYYDTAEWAATTASVGAMFPGGVGVLVDKVQEASKVIGDVCASTLMNLMSKDDGKYTLRMYDAGRSVSQALERDELLEVPTLEYDTDQLISSADVAYARQWYADTYSHLLDDTREADIFLVYGKYILGTFFTLLTTAADAQAFATAMLDLQGAAIRKFSLKLKLQPFDREVMDFITAYVSRASGGMLGFVTAEVLGKRVTASEGVVLDCRVVA